MSVIAAYLSRITEQKPQVLTKGMTGMKCMVSAPPMARRMSRNQSAKPVELIECPREGVEETLLTLPHLSSLKPPK